MKTTLGWLLGLCKGAAGRIIVPLDFENVNDAIAMVDKMVKSGVKFFKVGLEMIMTGDFVELLQHIYSVGGAAFLDGKLNDIPNTVAGAVKSLVRLGIVQMINVHCLGGFEMMKAAVAAAEAEAIKYGHSARPLIIGVTVLTSLDYNEIWRLGLVRRNPKYLSKVDREAALKTVVVKLALLAKDAGLDGVVASALHVADIKKVCGGDFLVVTPGIRFADGDIHDQKQVATPYAAAKNGSDFQVIGRAITKPADGDVDGAVVKAASQIEAGIASGIAARAAQRL